MKVTLGLLVLVAFVSRGDTVLSYHDNTPQWLTWGGTYRETWFHVEDFIPGATEFTVGWVDVWFWEIPDQVSVEIWNGAINPEEFLASAEINSSQSRDATRFVFDPPVLTGPDFCCIVNTESSSGMVQMLSDGTPGEHSFYSDDFLVWEEWTIGDYLITAGGPDDLSLQGMSWGGVKAVF